MQKRREECTLRKKIALADKLMRGRQKNTGFRTTYAGRSNSCYPPLPPPFGKYVHDIRAWHVVGGVEDSSIAFSMKCMCPQLWVTQRMPRLYMGATSRLKNTCSCNNYGKKQKKESWWVQSFPRCDIKGPPAWDIHRRFFSHSPSLLNYLLFFKSFL